MHPHPIVVQTHVSKQQKTLTPLLPRNIQEQIIPLPRRRHHPNPRRHRRRRHIILLPPLLPPTTTTTTQRKPNHLPIRPAPLRQRRLPLLLLLLLPHPHHPRQQHIRRLRPRRRTQRRRSRRGIPPWLPLGGAASRDNLRRHSPRNTRATIHLLRLRRRGIPLLLLVV